MISIKTPDELAAMRTAGRLMADLLNACCAQVHPGVTTGEIDSFARVYLKTLGDGTAASGCLGYHGYPGALCISVNEEVIHGIPGSRVLQRGDLVSLDVCGFYHGFCGDNTRTVVVGGLEALTPDKRRLLQVTRKALEVGVKAIRPGIRLGDVSHIIQETILAGGCSIVREFTGHGLGRALHEDPPVPNYGKPGKGPYLHEGMTLAIEPMVCLGKPAIRTRADGWTVESCDGKPSAHFEYTVAVLREGAEILTPWHEADPWSDAWLKK